MLTSPLVTRSHKQNDRDHSAIADGTSEHEDHLPRYFAKAGHADAEPNKTKKNGAGKGNWGREGDEIEDYAYNLTNPRRRSNSSTHAAGLKDFKTKFEVVEQEPVFEESLHGASAIISEDLEHVSTSDSANDLASVDGEDAAHKKL